MPDSWVCGDCRSVNSHKQPRCYRCHVLRAAGEMTAAAAVVAVPRLEPRTLGEATARMGVHYRPSWPIAVLLVPSIIVVLGLTLAILRGIGDLVGADGQVIGEGNTPAYDRLMVLVLWNTIVTFASWLGWSIWIVMVVRNAPALTGRWPSYTPVAAFLAPIVPIINLKRPFSVVRAVFKVLLPGELTPQVIALGWWLFWLASYYVPPIVMFARGGEFPTALAAALFAAWVGFALLLVSGILAASLVVITEVAQQSALRARDTTTVGPDLTPVRI